ncbi:MAG: hypothetical protein LPJ89_07940, partial [Hymenobacteraceae bacterium]|nr:hypothetical protein [Hymenobacteraceae bacterium]MDX5395388.1 hypothetical protein [Hymenobacteraceae bacterium]MDX5443693.1 hypothetical protein [Hymenobacteraceae bacterium]MDX5511437.1 hypothetical protein [Hymenobacteraceae bacterium]
TYLFFGPLLWYYLDKVICGEASFAGGLLNFSRGDKNDLVEGSVGVGYAYFLNNKVSIEPMISFRYFKRNLSDSSGSFDERDYGPFFSIGIGTYLYRDNVVQMK